ncbi:MAG: signal peptide peptidase SppA [Spirochaetaceae bacterium]|nr:signal peptide peptidase SppA [Spirochaetaceae bacterium]
MNSIRKFFLPIMVTVIISFPLTAQTRWEETPRVGIAVEDKSSASLVNMAALGAKDATGIGWSGYFNSDGSMDNTVNLSLGWLAYNYRQFNNTNNHEIGVGFPLYNGLYLGTSLRWTPDEGTGWNTHFLYRPYQWLSLGIKGESLNSGPWMDWGIGLRPLDFSDYWRSRLTLFYDGRVTSAGTYNNIATGLKMMPIDGVELYGHWDFRDEKLVTGINLSWNRFLLGGDVTSAGTDSWAEGSIQTFASLKHMRSISGHQKTMVVYDTAQVITDTPRLYAAAQDFMPDPNPTRSLYEFLQDMDGILKSPEIEAVLFSNQSFRTSFSNLIEIEQSLRKLKAAGKKIYFYGDSFGSTQYALAASVGDAIFMSPQGSLDLTGFGVSNLYFKDLLAKYGVNIYNFQSHEYKTAYNNLSESSMTSAQRESLEYVYTGLQNEMDRMITQGRESKLTENLEKLYAEGYWMSAGRAHEAGLVDELMYRDQMETWIGMRRYRVTMFSRIRWDMNYEWVATNHPTIAVIYANGNISMGEGARGQSIGAETLAGAIKNARYNPLIQGIVLRVNSGGGSALASDIIAREVALCTVGPQPKPIVISMGGVAASGGYMISAPGSKVLATPGTITGSIGVITMIPDISGLLDMFEVGVDTVTTTESADIPNIFRPLTAGEEERIRSSVMENYDSFINMVAVSRDMPVEAVDTSAQGRIWTGQQAMDRGLVDNMGGLEDAIELVEGLAGVKNARILEIDPGSIRFSIPGIPTSLAVFLDLKPKDPLAMVPEDLKDVIEFYKTVSSYEKGEALFLMPYTLKELDLDTRD